MEAGFKLNSWLGLFSLGVILFIVYWLIILAKFLFERVATRSIENKKIVSIIDRLLLLFKPIAVMLLLLWFISINYVTHTILLVAISVFGYHHIKNYIFGLFLKMNPLINEGAIVKLNDKSGELKTFLPFGVILNTEQGECYVNYSALEQREFSVDSNQEDVLRQTLFFDAKQAPEEIMDSLFNNPIIDFNEKPTIRKTEDNLHYKLQYTLENGASTQDLIAFLKQQNITVNTQLNTK